jgi:hypothetical protein
MGERVIARRRSPGGVEAAKKRVPVAAPPGPFSFYNITLIFSLGVGFSTQHRFLDLFGEDGQVHRQSVEQLPLRRVDSEVANQPALGRVHLQLFQMSLIVLHHAAPVRW